LDPKNFSILDRTKHIHKKNIFCIFVFHGELNTTLIKRKINKGEKSTWPYTGTRDSHLKTRIDDDILVADQVGHEHFLLDHHHSRSEERAFHLRLGAAAAGARY
jgi:hypothetical protein